MTLCLLNVRNLNVRLHFWFKPFLCYCIQSMTCICSVSISGARYWHLGQHRSGSSSFPGTPWSPTGTRPWLRNEGAGGTVLKATKKEKMLEMTKYLNNNWWLCVSIKAGCNVPCGGGMSGARAEKSSRCLCFICSIRALEVNTHKFTLIQTSTTVYIYSDVRIRTWLWL